MNQAKLHTMVARYFDSRGPYETEMWLMPFPLMIRQAKCLPSRYPHTLLYL